MCRFAKQLTMCLACLGMLVPQASVSASDEKARQGRDIQLAAGGNLIGTVVNAQGRPVAKARVVVRYQGTIVARTLTNAHGRFAVEGLRGGVHQVQTAHTSMAARFWAPRTGPVSARTAALLVSDARLVRAQGCADDSCTGCAEDGCGEGCSSGAPWGCGLFGGGMGGSSLLVGGLAVAGIATAVAVAANDDDDSAPSSP